MIDRSKLKKAADLSATLSFKDKKRFIKKYVNVR